jgi:hypothetical protein
MKLTMGPRRDGQSYEIVRGLKKLIQWQVAITEGDLKEKLLMAFETAKNAGRDLDVTFTSEPQRRSPDC